MKVWTAKYALSRGIYEAEVLPQGDFDYEKTRYHHIQHKRGTDSFELKSGAIARAEAMRLRKINSLTRQIAKLEGLTFA